MIQDERTVVREALDKLAVALADKGHTWSAEERSSYEAAQAILGRKEVRNCTFT